MRKRPLHLAQKTSPTVAPRSSVKKYKIKLAQTATRRRLESLQPRAPLSAPSRASL